MPGRLILILVTIASLVAAFLIGRNSGVPAVEKVPLDEKTVPSPPPELSRPAAESESITFTPGLSDLSIAPDWTDLEKYNHTLTRDEFLEQLESVYSVARNYRPFLNVTPDHVEVIGTEVKIAFAENISDKVPAQKYWSIPAPNSSERPLAGYTIALDPGHIGGDYAQLEERHFQLESFRPAREGTMTRIVAYKLAAKLRAAGANVSLTRTSDHPVTSLRPKDLTRYATEKYPDDPARSARVKDLLFYRTAEIRSRANLINTVLQPDLVVCLHFNAEAWGDPENPVLLNRNHLHLLVNGAYTDSEWAYPDQRFEALQRIFQNIHTPEKDLSTAVIDSFREKTDLPPYRYKTGSKRAVNIDSNPYLWARNLIAGRLYTCPVLFLEPYVMNSRQTYQRVQHGDYEGLIDGQPSLFEEYASAVADGIIHYASEPRP